MANTDGAADETEPVSNASEFIDRRRRRCFIQLRFVVEKRTGYERAQRKHLLRPAEREREHPVLARTIPRPVFVRFNARRLRPTLFVPLRPDFGPSTRPFCDGVRRVGGPATTTARVRTSSVATSSRVNDTENPGPTTMGFRPGLCTVPRPGTERRRQFSFFSRVKRMRGHYAAGLLSSNSNATHTVAVFVSAETVV